MNYKFRSRRNLVWPENGYVKKRILPDEDRQSTVSSAKFEADILSLLYKAGVSVPKLISHDADTLTMEYIEGITLIDAIEFFEQDKLSAEVLVKPLIGWFTAFYKAVPDDTIRGDVNCRNFILTPARSIVSVDFEFLPTGKKESDIGRLAAFILTYKPPHTMFKKYMVKQLIDEACARLDLDPVLINQAKELELTEMSKRR